MKNSLQTRRILRLESLENREMLNGLGLVDLPDQPEPEQTAIFAGAQTFSTPVLLSSTLGTITEVSKTNSSITINADGLDSTATYTLQWRLSDTTKWNTSNISPVSVTGETDQNFTITGLQAGSSYDIRLLKNSVPDDSFDTFKTEANTGTASYITTESAKISWSKVSGAKGPYTITLTDKNDDSLVFSTTSTNIVATGLKADMEYTYTVVDSSKTPKTLAENTFSTAAANADVDPVMTAAPTLVKGVYSSAKGAGQIKVTWKAPAQYVGSYTVTVSDGVGTTSVKSVLVGSKLEAVFAVTSDGSNGSLLENKTYSIIVEANTTNALISTVTYVTTGTIPSVAPGVPSIATATDATRPGGVDVTVTQGAGAEGCYVALYTGRNVPTPERNAMVFVPASGSQTISFSNLSGLTNGVAYSVGLDGTLSGPVYFNVTPNQGGWMAKKLATTGLTGAFKAVAEVDDPSNIQLTWTQGSSVTYLSSVPLKLAGWYLSYSTDSGNSWQYVDYFAQDAPGTEFNETVTDMLMTNTKVLFQLMPEYKSEDGTDSYLGKAIQTVLTVPKLKAPGKPEVPVTGNNGVEATVHWNTGDEAPYVIGYRVTVKDGVRAVLADTIYKDPSNWGSYPLVGLTPGARYSVEIVALTEDPRVFSSPLIVQFTALPYEAATTRATAPTITSATIQVTDLQFDPERITNGDDNAQYYYLEYTSSVDAKGQPDWLTGEIIQLDQTQFNRNGQLTVEIKKLNPGTQYFIRTITANVDVADGDAWDDATMVVAGSFAKFKTVAVPQTTIARAGYTMSGPDFAIALTGKTALQNSSSAILPAGTTFKYEVFVSTSSAVNSTNGSLDGGISLGDLDVTVLANNSGYLSDPLLFTDLAGALGDLTQFKSISFQFKVTYLDDTDTPFATQYTRACQLAMPSWLKIS